LILIYFGGFVYSVFYLGVRAPRPPAARHVDVIE
jgi:hypothetical protein